MIGRSDGLRINKSVTPRSQGERKSLGYEHPINIGFCALQRSAVA